MKGKKVIAFQGAGKDLEKDYRDLFENAKKTQGYKELEDQEEQVRLFLEGKVDVIVLDKSIFLWYLKKLSNRSIVEFDIHDLFETKNHYKVAFRDRNLRDIFNKNLEKIKNLGLYEQLFHTYLFTDIGAKTQITSLFSKIVAPYIFSESYLDIKSVSNTFLFFDF